MAQPAEPPQTGLPARALLRAGAIALLLVGAGLLARRSGLADLRAIRPTASGALALVVTGAVLTATGFPRQVVAFGGGYVFGAWEGAALALAAQIIGCALDYMAAHGLLADWARRRLARGGRVASLHRRLAARPFSTTLSLRLFPVGNNVALNLLAGVAGVKPAAFLAGSLLGYLPHTVIFALLGSGVQVGRGTQLAAAALLLLLAAGLGALLWRRQGEHVKA